MALCARQLLAVGQIQLTLAITGATLTNENQLTFFTIN